MNYTTKAIIPGSAFIFKAGLGKWPCVALILFKAVLSLKARHRFYVSNRAPWVGVVFPPKGSSCWKYRLEGCGATRFTQNGTKFTQQLPRNEKLFIIKMGLEHWLRVKMKCRWEYGLFLSCQESRISCAFTPVNMCMTAETDTF